MEPKTLTLQVGKFYKSRDGRIWEVVEKVPEGYSEERSSSKRSNGVYCVWAICHTTKTFNSFSTSGRSHAILGPLDEDLLEEVDYGDVAHELILRGIKTEGKRFVRSNGKLYCVNSLEEVCTYLYEELPPELKGVWRVQSTTIKNFTYEDYCKFYEIEPVYTKKLTPEEEFDNFVKSCKDGEWSKSLGCQKEAAVEFLIAYKNLMKAMGKFSDDVKSYPKCLIREVFKDYPEYAKFELPTMFKNQDGKDFKNFAAPLVEKMKKILN